MQKAIELGIGFVTGRANVCNIVNNYYKEMIKQVKQLDRAINITLFILYDLSYRGTDRLEFYKIIPAVYKDINIKFITPEDIEEENKNLISLRTSLIAIVALLAGGIVGIAIAEINIIFKIFLLLFGIYFEVLFISNIANMNKKIDNNIGVMKNELK